MKNDFNLLLVEDNQGDERLIRELLGEQHLIRFNIGLASSLKESESKIPENKFDIILLDLGLPDSSGLETLINLKLFFLILLL
jgi:CheY-like chemotaxis protein